MADASRIEESKELADEVCKLVRDPSLDQFIHQTVALFNPGKVELARPVLETLLRVARSVPWLAGALGHDPAVPLGKLGSPLAAQLEYVTRPTAVRHLAGPWDLAATMVGSEAEPMPGAENLRAALWVCHERWTKSGHPRQTDIVELASRIRGAVETRGRRAVENHPVARLFSAISKTRTLPAFLDAARPLLQSPSSALRDVWAKVDEELHKKAPLGPSAPIPPAGLRRRRSDEDDEDAEYESFVQHVHRVSVRRSGQRSTPIEGEPDAESAIPEVVAPLDGPTGNKDERRATLYHTRQVVWSQNDLLLTCHPDVLMPDLYHRVLTAVVAGIHEVEDSGLRIGMACLLLHGLTGRTTSRIATLRVTERLDVVPRSPFEISLSEAVMRIRVFFAQHANEPSGYFTRTPESAKYLEDVAETFVLPVPQAVIEALGTGDAVYHLGQQGTESLEAATREAARWVSDRIGFPVTVGQVRRSFSAHLFEQCRDLVVTQLVCGDTLGLSDAPAHYYAPKVKVLADAYTGLLNKIGFGRPRDGFAPSGTRTGSQLLVRLDVVQEMVAAVRVQPSPARGPISAADAIAVHAAMIRHLACMLLATTGHRPVEELFKLALDNIDLEGGSALFRDKVHDPAHDPRPVALPTCVTRQIEAYLSHLLVLADFMPALRRRVHLVLSGEARLMFGLDPNGMPVHLNWSVFSASLPPEWRRVPRNWGRTWLRTHGVEQGLPPELALIELGHFEACGYPFSGASPTELAEFVEVARPCLDRIVDAQGWEMAPGLGRTKHVNPELPPLRPWLARIKEHDGRTARDVAQQRVDERSKLRSYREAALQYVLAYPALVDAGIPELYTNKSGPWPRHGITKELAEAIRDLMAEDAGDDAAMRRARAHALRTVLRRVNRRVGLLGEEPAELESFRRPIDNGFLSGMMLAVRQINALRRHVLSEAKHGPGDWHDFARACARAACALALFGFCDQPEQIEGALRHRGQRMRLRSFDDAVLVPWGDEARQVVGLRGLAALALARLAKKYPANTVPSRAEINKALSGLLPDWAKVGSLPPKDQADIDWLQRLCETVSVSNRYELSAGARLALAADQGSTPAHIQEQAALLDGDAAGSIKREWEPTTEAATLPPEIAQYGPRRGNARTQYLALCAAIPSGGHDLLLPLTGVSVTADQLEFDGTRTKVIAEIEAQLALTEPDKVLQPVVRALAAWVLDMFKNGTQLRKNPANSTIETYLTRIGGALVERFGNGSLDDTGDAELEDAYLAAVECGDEERDAAARAVLQFHASCMRQFGISELDLAEVRAYLRSDQRNVDAALILPVERAAAVEWLRGRAETAASASEAGGRQRVRVERQALAAFPLYGWAGARRSEVLGVQFRDVNFGAGSEYVVRIRANRSRRVKTRSARRLIALPASAPRAEADRFRDWVEADRGRLLKWRSNTQYVFAPLHSGRIATGRSEIADAVMQSLRSATRRPRERIHRLRHLVAFERVTPIFLPPYDRETLAEVVAAVPEFRAGIALPRDLVAMTIPMGHAQPSTSLRCYFHFPWLLRSRADARITAKYLNRRGAAAVMGLTLVQVDKIKEKHAGAPPVNTWFDHVAQARVVRAAGCLPAQSGVVVARRAWSVVELGELVKWVERGKSLDGALSIVGADVADAPRIRGVFLLFEQRLGRRILGDRWVPDVGMPRRVIRDIEQATALERWWEWADDASNATRRYDVENLSTRVWELMVPGDRDRVRVAETDGDMLAQLLVAAGIDGKLIERQPLGMGFEFVRVLRPSLLSVDVARSGKLPAVRYLGAAIKRSLCVVWVALRLRVS